MAKNSAFQLTVLTAGVSATKTYSRGEGGKIEVEGYGRAKTFTAETLDTDRKGEWLKSLAKKKNSFVVLGEPVGWKPGEKKRRLSSDRDEDKATLVDVPRALMPIDVDQIDFEPWAAIDDGEMFASELLERLGLKGVGCVWHLTSGHGFFNRYRARLWIELSEPATAAQMKQYARERWGGETVDVKGIPKNLVDFSVYQAQQPIYTANPILKNGIESPVRRRVGYIEGDALEIKVAKKERERLKGTRFEKPEDDNVALLQAAGLYIERLKPGQHCIDCPWEEGHTGESRRDDTFYFQPHFNGHDIPAFKCHHDTCADKKWEDVLKYLDEELPPEHEDGENAPNWVFIYRLKSFWDARDGAIIDKESYDFTHGGKTKRGTPTERFIAMERSQKADMIDFLPGRPRFIDRDRVRVLNTYIDKRLEPDDTVDVTPWIEHLEWLIPDKRDRENLSDWLAWAYQKPGQKITWGPIMYGVPGTGKTSVFSVLAECLGRQYVSEPTQAELEDKFNDWAFGKLLVKIEELMSGDKYHVAEKLKPVVANATLSIRQMHRSGFVATNVANVGASTNHMKALPLERGDRRWMLIQCIDAGRPERIKHMKALWRWLESEGFGGIAAWFADRDVSTFVPTAEAPNSDLKERIIESSLTDVERAIDACSHMDTMPVISSEMIATVLEAQGCRLDPRNYGLIAYRRKWLSLDGQRGRVRMGNQKVTFWASGGNRMRLEAFLAKKPAARRNAHEKMIADCVYDRTSAADDTEEAL